MREMIRKKRRVCFVHESTENIRVSCW